MVGSNTILPPGGAKGSKSKSQVAVGGTGKEWSPCWLHPLWHRRHPWLLAPPTASASSPLLCSTSSVTQKSNAGLKVCGQAFEESKGRSLHPQTWPQQQELRARPPHLLGGKGPPCCRPETSGESQLRLSSRRGEDWPWGLLGPGEAQREHRQPCSGACPQQTPKNTPSALPPAEGSGFQTDAGRRCS